MSNSPLFSILSMAALFSYCPNSSLDKLYVLVVLPSMVAVISMGVSSSVMVNGIVFSQKLV